jgi:UDP-2,3-diacylglucosamine hydrolase
VPGLEPAAALSTRCGALLLPDPSVVDLFGVAVLLTHGDALCTDDHAYQQLRTTLRMPQWQTEFLARPIAQRRAYARELRERSEQDKATKSSHLMDVNDEAVAHSLRTAGVLTMIHGHTHRPARHATVLDRRQANRWVLPDWDVSMQRGGFLTVHGGGWQTSGQWAAMARA